MNIENEHPQKEKKYVDKYGLDSGSSLEKDSFSTHLNKLLLQ